jgi:hypothetical protein
LKSIARRIAAVDADFSQAVVAQKRDVDRKRDGDGHEKAAVDRADVPDLPDRPGAGGCATAVGIDGDRDLRAFGKRAGGHEDNHPRVIGGDSTGRIDGDRNLVRRADVARATARLREKTGACGQSNKSENGSAQ